MPASRKQIEILASTNGFSEPFNQLLSILAAPENSDRLGYRGELVDMRNHVLFLERDEHLLEVLLMVEVHTCQTVETKAQVF